MKGAGCSQRQLVTEERAARLPFIAEYWPAVFVSGRWSVNCRQNVGVCTIAAISRDCPTTTIREDHVEPRSASSSLRCSSDRTRVAEAKAYLDRRLVEMEGSEADVKGALQLSLDNAKARVNRLTDAFVDGLLEKPLFEERRHCGGLSQSLPSHL